MHFHLHFQQVYHEFVDPDTPTSIADDTYDVVLTCAGFFHGLISPRAFKELIRITKKGLKGLRCTREIKCEVNEPTTGGLIMWNITEGYETIGRDYEGYDEIVDGLIEEGKWEHHCPIKR